MDKKFTKEKYLLSYRKISSLINDQKKIEFRFSPPGYFQRQKLLIVFSFIEGVGKQMPLCKYDCILI